MRLNFILSNPRMNKMIAALHMDVSDLWLYHHCPNS
jgi:hypothetical protein